MKIQQTTLEKIKAYILDTQAIALITVRLTNLWRCVFIVMIGI
jgi:hypothetical protein